MRKRYFDSACGSDHVSFERLRRFPAEQSMLANGLRAVAALIIRGWLRVYHRFEIVGQDQLRTNRSLVIVANHSSHLDTLCLLSALPLRSLHRAFPVAAADYFYQNGPRLWIAGVLNALPFGRKLQVRRSLSICADLISDTGNILIIFPEGTRSTTGQTQEFKPGVGALVAGRDVTVVPCYLHGAFEAWPKGKRLPRPKKVRLIIGAPRKYAACSTDKGEISSIAAELRAAVEKLGKRYGSG
jgi:1-acyl-sn-glycerol-3-phosphate acyltransferase